MRTSNKEVIIKRIYGDKNQEIGYEEVAEVVRCKDCKYRYLSGVGKQYYVCDFLDAELKENGYCSYGERKEQEHE